MTIIAMGSDEARREWERVCDTAHAGTEVQIKRHDQPYVTLISSSKLRALQSKIAELERRQKEEDFKASVRQLGELIIKETDASNDWITNEEFLARSEVIYGPQFILAAKEGRSVDVAS